MTKNNNPICLFDSGIGGLTVLKKLIHKYPNENYIYLADLANVPYGDKTKSEITEIATNNIEWLVRFNPKVIIMACNTSSSVLCEQGRINPAPTIPLHGMIQSLAKEIAKSNYSKVSIWATKLVTENNAYKNAINKLNPKITVEEISCPKLVPMIESLNFNEADKIKIIQEYLNMTSKDSQALILGCTHYPHIQNDIKKLRDINIIDPADALVRELEQRTDMPQHVSTNNKSNVSLYTTAQKEKVERFFKIYIGEDIKANLIALKKVVV